MIGRKHCSKYLLLPLMAGAAMLFGGIQPLSAAYLVQPNAYWQLEETDPGTTGVADDISTNNGVCTTCPTAGTAGQVGNGFVFDGVDDAVVLNDPSDNVFDFAAGSSFSIELWMKRNGAPGASQAFIGRYAGASNVAWWVGVNSTGTASAHFWDADGPYNATRMDGVTNIVDDQWHYIVVVRDGVADKIMIYVDGALDAVRNGDANTDGDFGATAAVNIGKLGSSLLYAGALDNVAIYSNSALSADVILQNYLNGSQGQDLDNEFAPAFNGSVSDTVAVGFNVTMQARAAGNPVATFSSTDLPADAAITPSGELTWQPKDTQSGHNIFNVIATNSQGTASQAYDLNVIDLCSSSLNAYWKLEETDPATTGVVDETGVADGTCTTCPTAGTAGRVGNGFVFDGVDDAVVLNDPSDNVFDFAAGSSFSIELWMKRNGAPGASQAFIGRYAGASNVAWWVGVNSTGTASAHFWDADGPYNATRMDGVTNIVDDQWHHIVVVRDGVADKIMIYVDGALDAVRNGDANTDGDFGATAAVNIGKLGSSLLYAGALDEIAVYNIALPETIIGQHFNAQAGQYYCNSAPVITGQQTLETLEDTDLTIDFSDLTVTDSDNSYPTNFTMNVAAGTDYTATGTTITPAANFNGTLSVAVTVNDGVSDSAPYMLQVTVTPVNDAPVITSSAPTTATPETAYSYDADATDDDGDALTWALSGEPAGMTVDINTGVVSWTPPAGTQGDVTYTLSVSDGNGGTSSEVATVTVGAASSGSPSGGGGGGGGGCFIETAGSGTGNATASIMSISALLAALGIGLIAAKSGNN